LNDLAGDDLPPVVDVEVREFRTPARSPTRVEDVNGVSVGAVLMDAGARIAGIEIPGRMLSAAVVMDDERIFVGRVNPAG
jgi:hypothetical protein